MVRQAAVTIDAPARRPRDNARRGRRGREALPVRSTRLFGIPLAEVAYDDVLDLVNRALAAPSDTPLTLDAINTMGLSESCFDPRMRDALLTYDVIVPDGM